MNTLLRSALRILFFLFVGIIFISLIRTIWTSYQALQHVEEEEQRIEIIEAETEKLEQQLKEATSSFELERRARENLQLQKDNETIIRVE